jgi:hypothetical protein
MLQESRRPPGTGELPSGTKPSPAGFLESAKGYLENQGFGACPQFPAASPNWAVQCYAEIACSAANIAITSTMNES